MDEISEILKVLEDTIRAEDVFKDAHIYQRGEELTDLPVEDVSVPSIYLKVLDPIVPASDFHLDFRTYPVQVTVKIEGRNDENLKDDEDERNAIQNKRFEYLVALMGMVKQYPTNTGTITYKVDARDPKLDVPPTTEQKKADEASGQKIHRIQLTYLFQTVQEY